MFGRWPVLAIHCKKCRGLAKYTLPRSSEPRTATVPAQELTSRIYVRLAHNDSGSRGNQKLIGRDLSNRQWLLCFGGLSLAIIVGTYIRKERTKKMQKEIFESKIETCEENQTFPGAFKYGGYVFPPFVKGLIQDVKDFTLRDEDILVVSYPKSGTTWMQEIVYLIKEGVEKEADSNVEERFPYLEYVYPGIKEISKKEGPRFIKSHMPYPLLPDDVRANKGKIICVVRNPKDTAVSYYHFARMLTEVNYRGTFKEFFDAFINNKDAYGPWWNHIASFYLHKDDENMLIISYEDMHMDPIEAIGKVAEFLGKQLSEQEKSVIAAKTSFKSMVSNPKVNYSWWDEMGLRNKEEAQFLRKGKVGDWKNFMDEEMSKQVDDIVKRYLEPLGCNFVYEIKKS